MEDDMTNIFTTKVFLVFLICFVSISLFANLESVMLNEGVISGGGGRGIFCSDKSHANHGQLLDIFEADAIWQFSPVSRDLPEDLAIDFLANRYVELIYHPQIGESKDDVLQDIKGFLRRKDQIHFIKPGQQLLPVNDSLEPIAPIGCDILQVAHYYTNKVLLIDPELWSQMKPIDQIALLIHEYAYLSLRREEGHTDSRFTRYIVGKLSSTSPLNAISKNLKPVSKYYYCKNDISNPPNRSEKFEFYIFDQCKESSCLAYAQFIIYANHFVLEMDPIMLGTTLEQIEKYSGGSSTNNILVNWTEMNFQFSYANNLKEVHVGASPNKEYFVHPEIPSEVKVNCTLVNQ